MNWIIAKKNISEDITKIEIKAAEIALNQKPGQHVIVQISKNSEPVQLIISSVNKPDGTISLFIHKKGIVHHQLANLIIGDQVFSVNGPYGDPIKIDNIGTVICAAGGVGISPLFPVIEAMKAAGNKVITIIGARTKEYLILQKELERISDELIVYTDDGSCGEKGLLTEGISKVIKREGIKKVIAFGPSRMIKYTTLITRQFNLPLIATLYSMRIDGIGMNASYRVSICKNSKYICVDGYDFNAYYADFDIMIKQMDCRTNEVFLGNQNYQIANYY